jgi:hypothetical protein
VLILRTTRIVNGKLIAHGYFEWPTEPGSLVAAATWEPKRVCGGGLHGLKWGNGDVGFLNWADADNQNPKAVAWQVVEAEENLVVDMDGKCKFPYCRVVYTGDRSTACAIVSRYSPYYLEYTDRIRRDLTQLPHKLYSWHSRTSGYEEDDEVLKDHRWEVPAGPLATLITSEIDDPSDPGQHSIMLDLDVPAKLVPSSTHGHSHLYIDVRTTWPKYEALLNALADAEVIERGYAAASLRRKSTALRLPWAKK